MFLCRIHDTPSLGVFLQVRIRQGPYLLIQTSPLRPPHSPLPQTCSIRVFFLKYNHVTLLPKRPALTPQWHQKTGWAPLSSVFGPLRSSMLVSSFLTQACETTKCLSVPVPCKCVCSTKALSFSPLLSLCLSGHLLPIFEDPAWCSRQFGVTSIHPQPWNLIPVHCNSGLARRCPALCWRLFEGRGCVLPSLGPGLPLEPMNRGQFRSLFPSRGTGSWPSVARTFFLKHDLYHFLPLLLLYLPLSPVPHRPIQRRQEISGMNEQ